MSLPIEKMCWKLIIYKFFRIYFESLVAVLFITYFKPTVTFSEKNVIANAFYLTVIIYLLRMYNRELYDKARTGLFVAVGSCLV